MIDKNNECLFMNSRNGDNMRVNQMKGHVNNSTFNTIF